MSEDFNDHEQTTDLDGGAKLVPVAEAIKYRRRAQQAESMIESFEQQLGELQSKVQTQEQQLNEATRQRQLAQQAIVEMENRTNVEKILLQAGAVDAEAAGILLGKKLDMNEKLTPEQINQAVTELFSERPYMKSKASPSAMPGMTQSPQDSVSGAGHLTGAAKKAAESGNRKDIAEYLRLRRQYATMP